tara:strand:- start:46 stop:249 length:204 start_codon:yes stop_codon:yes gene_type:complete
MADDIDPKTDVYLIPATKGDKIIIKIFINNKCIEKEYTLMMLWNLIINLLNILWEKILELLEKKSND